MTNDSVSGGSPTTAPTPEQKFVRYSQDVTATSAHVHTDECHRRQPAVEAVIASASQLGQDEYRRALTAALIYRCGLSA